MKRITFTLALLCAAALAGCKARKTYPDANLGWHSRNYAVIFGRLERIPARNPDDPPVWLISYSFGKDPYHGELALTPPDKLTGYSGGEMVEIHGMIKPESASGGNTGTSYEIQAIRLWTGYSGQ